MAYVDFSRYTKSLLRDYLLDAFTHHRAQFFSPGEIAPGMEENNYFISLLLLLPVWLHQVDNNLPEHINLVRYIKHILPNA